MTNPTEKESLEASRQGLWRKKVGVSSSNPKATHPLGKQHGGPSLSPLSVRNREFEEMGGTPKPFAMHH
jgi:hypothetical protein